MDVKTFRAKTMQQALAQVREELGPQAAVLHTRELNCSLFGRWVFGRQYEVAASAVVNVPSRLPATHSDDVDWNARSAAPLDTDYRAQYRADFRRQVSTQLDELQSLVGKLIERSQSSPQQDMPNTLFDIFTQMIEADIDEKIARSLVDRARADQTDDTLSDPLQVKSRVAELLEKEMRVSGPITLTPGTCRIVALVGPTGVGKTTTIAKLAANFRLREKKRVGLITVDTYRVAAVEQLRTYADIIDLPMEVVATPREMREAVARLSDLDLILMDTAGRSPRDEVKIQELKSMLAEAEAHEVHLVLSATSGSKTLVDTADRFTEVGTTAVLLTKLDEATSIGHTIALQRQCRLPISYLTNGQNVPDDIAEAEPRQLAQSILSLVSSP
jgi:flagellar biosynthesis protein FlhF